MNRERKKGLTYSSAFHLLLLLIAVFGLPYLFPPDELAEPVAITVDVLPVAAISNVRPSQVNPAPKEEEKKEEKPEEKKPEPPKPEEKKEEKKPAPPVKSAEPEPEPEPQPEEKPEPKKEEKKPEEKKPEPPKPVEKKKPKEDPLDAILKSVKETASEESSSEEKKEDTKETSSSPSKSKSTRFDPNAPEALSIRDSISNQVYKCWNVQGGARNAHELAVLVQVEYDKTGQPTRVELATSSAAKAATNPAYRSAAEAAKRAVRRCAPLKGMPPESYHIWQSVEINFDPKDMLF